MTLILLSDFDLEKFTVESSKSYFEEKDVLFCAIGTTRAAASRQPGNTTVSLHINLEINQWQELHTPVGESQTH